MDASTEGYIPEVLIEDRKVRYLKLCVDLSLSLISRGEMSKRDAMTISRKMRNLTLSLFPDKGETFDMIYAPRFKRAIDEAYGTGGLRQCQEKR